MNYKRSNKKIIISILMISLALIFNYLKDDILKDTYSISEDNNYHYTLMDVLKYNGEDYVVINNNIPYFKEEEMTTATFEEYGKLDNLNRCTLAYANVSKETMPKTSRESIGTIKPTGWQTVKYDIVDGKYLYNRCHLIGYQLTGENANKNNLITCTRNMNSSVMLKFENEVTSYIKKTNNHVLYRVTPIFENDNLLATGVLMEAKSVEDNGEGVMFNVFVYNVQEGIIIDYSNGDSYLE